MDVWGGAIRSEQLGQPKVAWLTGRLGAARSDSRTRSEAQAATMGALRRRGRANSYGARARSVVVKEAARTRHGRTAEDELT